MSIISFGGVIAFIYADLLILPILNIYRKYYGTHMTLVCSALSTPPWWAPDTSSNSSSDSPASFPPSSTVTEARRGEARRGEASISWNYTTWINIAFLVVATVLVVRFVGTGGSPMLRMTNGMSDADHRHDHHATAEEH